MNYYYLNTKYDLQILLYWTAWYNGVDPTGLIASKSAPFSIINFKISSLKSITKEQMIQF